MKHIISFTSMLWVMLNLLFWLTLLLPVALMQLLAPWSIVKTVCANIIRLIYRAAVKLNTFWMTDVMRIQLKVFGEVPQHDSPVVICNHQSWFDIPLVQELITQKGPMVTFLVKREIVWIPIIGWICLALNFPRLYRRKQEGARESDFTIIQKASSEHSKDKGALLIFPEGTRFTPDKKSSQKVQYTNLLRPKSGGLSMIKNHMPSSTPLVDITIDYGQQVNIWRCLRGDPSEIYIHIHEFQFEELQDVEQWLNDRWSQKDELFRQY